MSSKPAFSSGSFTSRVVLACVLSVQVACVTSSAAFNDPNAGVYDDYYGSQPSKAEREDPGGGGDRAQGDRPTPKMVTTTAGRKPRKGKAKSLLAKRPPVDGDTKPRPQPKDLPTPDEVVITAVVPTLAPMGSVVTVFGEGVGQPGSSAKIGDTQQKVLERAPGRLDFELQGGSGPVTVMARFLRSRKQGRSEASLETMGRGAPFSTPRKDPNHGLVGDVYRIAGAANELPDFGSLGEPVATIAVPNLAIASRQAGPLAGLDAFGVHFRGSLNIVEAGDYTLCLNAGDGAQLYLDQTLVVDNDGRHETQEVCEPLAVEAGEYALDLLYYQAEPGEMGLELLWSKDGGRKQPIPTKALFPPMQ